MSLEFRKAVGKTIGTGLAIQLLSALSGVLLARTLGPEGRGLYAAILVAPLLITGIVGLGFSPYLARRAAQENSNASMSVLVSEAVTLAGIQSLLGVLIITILTQFEWPNKTAGGGLSLWFCIIWIPINQLIVMLTSIDQGKENWDRYNLTRFSIYPSHLFLLLILWASSMLTVTSALAAMIVATSIAVVLRLKALITETEWKWIGVHGIRHAFAGSLPYAAISVTTICVTQADALLATRLMNHRNAGYYMVALAVAQLLVPISRSAGQVVFTHAARSPSTSAIEIPSGMRFAARFLIFALASLSVALMLGLALQFLIPFVYGLQYQDAVSIAYFMLPGGFANALSTIIEEHLKGLGKPMVVTKILWLTLFIFLSLGPPLTEHISGDGLAMAFSAAQCVRLISLSLAVKRIEKIKWIAAFRYSCGFSGGR